MEEHQFLSEILEMAVAQDGLNPPALRIFEMAARRYQLYEQLYADVLKSADAKVSGAQVLQHDEKRLFLGVASSRGLAMVSPLLEKHVSQHLQERSTLAQGAEKGKRGAGCFAKQQQYILYLRVRPQRGVFMCHNNVIAK